MIVKRKRQKTDGCWHSSTGISPRPMLMGAAHDALRASNARVSLSCLRVLAHRLPHLFYGLVFVALLFGRGPVLRTCNRVMAHRPTGSTQTDRIRLPYAAPEASRRAFFVKELWTLRPDCQGKERERNLPRTFLDWQHLETRHDAMYQLRFQPEPHIFIHIQVLVPILVLYRPGGKSPNVLLIVSDHGGKITGIGIGFTCPTIQIPPSSDIRAILSA